MANGIVFSLSFLRCVVLAFRLAHKREKIDKLSVEKGKKRIRRMTIVLKIEYEAQTKCQIVAG